MELSEIIKSTLSIFSAISVVLITISFAIYKIKDRSRVKPYLKADLLKTLHGTIIYRRKPDSKYANKRTDIKDKFDKKKTVTNDLMKNRFNIVNGNKKAVLFVKQKHVIK
jgi:hypothetical protein